MGLFFSQGEDHFSARTPLHSLHLFGRLCEKPLWSPQLPVKACLLHNYQSFIKHYHFFKHSTCQTNFSPILFSFFHFCFFPCLSKALNGPGPQALLKPAFAAMARSPGCEKSTACRGGRARLLGRCFTVSAQMGHANLVTLALQSLGWEK